MATLDSIHLQYQDRLPMWVIYRPTTSDYPGKWVIRMHLSLPKPQTTSLVLTYPSLDTARDNLPRGLTNIGRRPDDDPVIEEVWL
jgi:hypothetical protein